MSKIISHAENGCTKDYTYNIICNDEIVLTVIDMQDIPIKNDKILIDTKKYIVEDCLIKPQVLETDIFVELID